MFTEREIADYYNSTQNHYTRWWNLGEILSLHYGIWDENVKSFSGSLVNTNRIMMEIAGISMNDRVLDAGCGVGGAAFYINKMKNADVTGISLSEKQINYAGKVAAENNVADRVSFHIMDFTRTSFQDESFDVVWACESACQATDKEAFMRECYRILKKGGRIVLGDFFLTDDNQEDKHSWIRKWCDTWAVSGLISCDAFTEKLKENGFNPVRIVDYTDKIKRSARRMYYASMIGALPSEIYNLFHPKVTRFARTHYKCGYYQYKALMEGLWKYWILLVVK
jgi:tocopherol O-methyltransferase